MKVLVTGGGGTLASYIPNAFPKDKVILASKKTLDVTKPRLLNAYFLKNKPDLIIHLAAMTNVDDAEKNPKKANLINAKGSENVAKAASKISAKIIYVSTSAIFDGSKRQYFEEDEPKPANKYGKSKLEGEKAIQKMTSKHFIIRCGWIIGGGKKEKKFLSHIAHQIDEGKTEIMAVSDLFGTIAYGKELAKFMSKLGKTEKYGIYHFGSEGTVSRYQLAKNFVNILGAKVKITPVPSSFFDKKFSAPRSKYEVVKSHKNKYDSTWIESLKRYVKDEIRKR